MSDNLAMEKILETAMVDLAYDLLKNKGEPMIYRDIMNEVAKLKGFTEEEIEQYIAQLYTEVNIDGRFICVGRSLWGLRDWYSVEQSTDSAVAASMKDDYLDDELEEDYYDEEETFNIEDDDIGDLDGLDDTFAETDDDSSFADDTELEEDEVADEEEEEEEL